MENKDLIDLAIKAREKAYTPYSQFKVGAVLVDENGGIHAGCNIENAAYSPTNCAERTAVFRAIADGNQPRTFRKLAVVADTKGPVSPCGVCRQVMMELCGPDMPIVLGNINGDFVETTIGALLPGAFTLVDD